MIVIYHFEAKNSKKFFGPNATSGECTFSGTTIMIFFEFNMFKYLEQLQINDCQTDICLVGAGGVKVFIHRTILFADNGKFVVIVPDASYADISDSSSFL